MGKYLKLTSTTRFPPTLAKLQKHIVDNNTGSLPFGSIVPNPRTLWSHVPPRIDPSGRAHLVLFRTSPSNIDDYSDLKANGVPVRTAVAEDTFTFLQGLTTTIGGYSTILMYGDGMDAEEMVTILGGKVVGVPYIEGVNTSENTRDVMRAILSGARSPVGINFHTDFIGEYDIEKDRQLRGRYGRRQFNAFLQDVQLAMANKSKIDIWGLYALHALAAVK
jgi:hypothetical protein